MVGRERRRERNEDYRKQQRTSLSLSLNDRDAAFAHTFSLAPDYKTWTEKKRGDVAVVTLVSKARRHIDTDTDSSV